MTVLNAVTDTLAEVVVRGHDGPKRTTAFMFARQKNFFIVFSFFFVDNYVKFAAALAVTFVYGTIATIVTHILCDFERDVLRSRRRVSAWKRLGTGFAFGLRMVLVYVAVLIVSIRSLWVVLSLLLGHVVGWVIYSAMVQGHAVGTIDQIAALRSKDKVKDDMDGVDDVSSCTSDEV